jgi:hypothetical protein
MKFVLLAGLLAMAAATPTRFDPDTLMVNEGMMGGDIPGGMFELAKDPATGKTTVIPNGSYIYWPGSVMYYEIHSSLSGDRAAIEDAMNEYMTRTCLRFEDRAGRPEINNYVLIRGDKSGCWSYMGMYTGGPQEVSLQQNGCVWKGIIIHELMHAAGFWHEQQRYDRDDYVIIHWENMDTSMQSNFEKNILGVNAANVDNSAYDIESIMHYELTAFSSNGQPTIEPIGSLAGQDPGFVWQQNTFSDGDVSEINAVYC